MTKRLVVAVKEDGIPDEAENDDQRSGGGVELDGEEEVVVQDAECECDDTQEKGGEGEVKLALLFRESVGDGEEGVGGQEKPHPRQQGMEIRCGARPLGAEDETEERLGIEIEECEHGQRNEADYKDEASDEASKRQSVAQSAIDFDIENPLGGVVEDVDRAECEGEGESVEADLCVGNGESGGEPDKWQVAGESIDKVF